MDLNGRINLERVSILLLDDAPEGLDIMNQVFTGFGARNLNRANSVDHARQHVLSNEVDLIVANDELGGANAYDFVSWLRRMEGSINIFTPVIIISGHTRRTNVGKARDCGANFMVAKPISPQVMLERVIWVSRDKRPFLEAGEYVGPDRRHRDPTPDENKGRRKHDRRFEPMNFDPDAENSTEDKNV
jgi:DNA-binding response OmpR family regulator